MAHQSPTATRTRAVRLAACAFAGLLLLGACGKKDEPAQSNNTQTTSGGTSSGTSKSGGGTPGDTSGGGGGKTGTTLASTQSLNTTVWFNGFKIALGDIVMDKKESTLSIAATLENLGPDNSNLYATMSIEQDGAVAYTGYQKDNPNVVAKSKAKDEFIFSIDDKYDASKATLVMGNGDQQQVKVPMSGSGKQTTLQPADQPQIKGEFVVGQVTLTPDVAQARYDNPIDHSQADKDKAYLIISGKSKNASAENNYYESESGAVLTLPDGTKQSAESFSIKDLGPTKNSEFTMVFIIATPFPGPYTLTLTQNWSADSSEVSASVNFDLVPASTGTTSGTTPGSTPGTAKK